MKIAISILLSLLSTGSFAQQTRDKLVVEVSPVNIFFSRGFMYSIQGSVEYSFKNRFQLTGRYNQTLQLQHDFLTPDLKPDPYSPASYAQLGFSASLYDTENHNRKTPHLCHAFKVEAGIMYFRQETKNLEYYTYDTTALGQRKVIKGKNTLSLTLGFQYQIREYKVKDTTDVRLQRQHRLSLGVIYGLDYFLPAFSNIPGEYPSFHAPKDYAFDRWGVYFRYNFRQQITRNLFAGLDLYCAINPYVQYRYQNIYYVPRGSEGEMKIKPYAGITVGWAFL
ncbi:hypothetical protein [Fluviicola taffensis]|uniref:Outer membrane protein beta-barrel domain-containing protein n=1 Tax=Fluviicola taffensis (strain DSM 16823 / NCIMB 13979 / RW262) TaxID=755732 RepID=F2IEE1_FLUTR|nr:hypothetical protein [Fluviicola taffensis]AEA43465.1 hypothetical protein Fluta_1471 [Fluviicola taffensis DSM 16823]